MVKQFTSIGARNGKGYARGKSSSIRREIIAQGGRNNHVGYRTATQSEVKKILEIMDNKCSAFCQYYDISWTYGERVELVEVGECISESSELSYCEEFLTSLRPHVFTVKSVQQRLRTLRCLYLRKHSQDPET